MATAAPEATPAEGSEEPKKKKPILLIAGIAVVAIVVMVAVAFGTLYFSGFYEKKAELAAMDKLEELEAAATKAKAFHAGTVRNTAAPINRPTRAPPQ
jgi:flagellar basal body-associated protein FliL